MKTTVSTATMATMYTKEFEYCHHKYTIICLQYLSTLWLLLSTTNYMSTILVIWIKNYTDYVMTNACYEGI
jgi:hypothetical protein